MKRVFDGADAADESVDLLVKRDALREFHNFVRGPHHELDKVFKVVARENVFGLPPVRNAPEPVLRRMFVSLVSQSIRGQYFRHQHQHSRAVHRDV